MNAPYPIPSSTYTNVGYFYANNSNYQLGSYTKNIDDSTLITVDYTQLSPTTTITVYQFIIDIGGSPPLLISNPALSGNILKFVLSGGVAGVTYNLKIMATNTYGVRTDTLIVNVPSDGCDCISNVNCGSVSVPGQPVSILGTGSYYFSSLIRYFIQGSAPIGANVMDWWYDTLNNSLNMYVSNGNQQSWMQIGGPSIVISNYTEEQVTVTAINTFAPLQHGPPATIMLIINKQVFTPAGTSPDFVVSGKQITWMSTIYSVQPTDVVVAVYTY